MDAEVVGSGPNGMAAAVILARAGLTVRVYELSESIGGSAGTNVGSLGEGVLSDAGSAVHPMAVASPFFKAFELASRVKFFTPEISYAHPVEHGRAGIAFHDLGETAASLGREGKAWRRAFAPLVHHIDAVSEVTSGTLFSLARRPDVAARIGLRFAAQVLQAPSSRESSVTAAMLAGLHAHSIATLPSLGAAAVGLVLGAHAHARGWPIPKGGSQSIITAMADDLIEHGGSLEVGHRISNVRELSAPIKILDVSPTQFRAMDDALPPGYRARLARFRYGGAASKVDFLLSEPVPWRNADVARAGTVHVGGNWADIARGERQLRRGIMTERPYVLVSQPSLFDESRAPDSNHVLWSYTHAPAHSNVDMTEVVTRQIEHYAPGFRDVIVASVATTSEGIARQNVNHVGGDFATGAVTLDQLLARPTLSLTPWRTPSTGVYLCSAGTSPGPGVHGMAGYHAARLALKDVHGVLELPDLGIHRSA